MKKHSIYSTVLMTVLLFFPTAVHCLAQTNANDSVFLFAYTTDNKALKIAYSTDRQQWKSVENGGSVLSSDFGPWGSQKRMYDPFLTHSANGKWICVWGLGNNINQFAVATSDNLFDWMPQEYPYMKAPNCLKPEIYNVGGNDYFVFFRSASGTVYRTASNDLYHFSSAVITNPNAFSTTRENITIDGKTYGGNIVRAPQSLLTELSSKIRSQAQDNSLYNEFAKDDSVRFSDIREVNATVNINSAQTKTISDKLVGIFFEDINYAADGGLYAELVQNRDFEYTPSDRGKDAQWNALTAWNAIGNATLKIDTIAPIHPNNPHYVVLSTHTSGEGISNMGYDGIVVRKGERYNFSLFARTSKGKTNTLSIRLVKDDVTLAENKIILSATGWRKYHVALTAKNDADNAVLQITPSQTGSVALDMVSLFPENTFKHRPNGLRADLAQTLADLHPKFMRFPGGCVSHGNGLENIYNWKETIGPLEARRPQRNIWNYHQSKGLGFYEFFQFCEDIGCEPLPVLAAGVCCQNSSVGGFGQQGGIPMAQMPRYTQDILDLIEWANGDAKTSVWGRKRAEQGHPAPFHLKYIGIGNEDLISKVFEERYLMIVKAIKAKYPDITVCGTVGPFYKGSDYTEGWRVAHENHIDMVDEHYYVSPSWFYYNQHFYDNYQRNNTKVYVGEYAAHVPARTACIETALAEALHICNLERNGDVVSMSSYAPLLAKDGHTQWNPDLIRFNNTSVRLTPDYYAQQLCSVHSGDTYIPCSLTSDNTQHGINERIAVSVVRDTRSGNIYIKLVNALPFYVNTTLNLDPTNTFLPQGTTKQADLSILTGQPADTNARPMTSTINVSSRFPYNMPPYSFTVIAIKK